MQDEKKITLGLDEFRAMLIKTALLLLCNDKISYPELSTVVAVSETSAYAIKTYAKEGVLEESTSKALKNPVVADFMGRTDELPVAELSEKERAKKCILKMMHELLEED